MWQGPRLIRREASSFLPLHIWCESAYDERRIYYERTQVLPTENVGSELTVLIKHHINHIAFIGNRGQ